MEDRPEDQIDNQPAELSEREIEILRLLATGLSNKEIAAQLYLSINTVKVHLRNIFAKLGVQSRTEATLVALQRGYVTVPGTAVANGAEPAASESVEGGEPSSGEAAAVSAAASVPVATPAVEIEPPLPIWRRLALIGIAALAVGLALVAVPRGSAQNSNGIEPFSDSHTGSAGITAGVGNTAWQQVSSMSQGRGRLAVAALKSEIVAIGGETASGVTGLVEIWDAAQQKWRTGQSKPVPVANIGAAVVAGKVIVPGGYTAAGTPTAVVEAYDLISDTWTSLAALPEPRLAYALATYEDKVYLFGGSDGQGYANTTYIYDPSRNLWTTGAPLPVERGFAAAAPLGDSIYVVGGFADGHEFNRCDRYLPKADRWEQCAPMFVARGGLSLAPVAGQLLAVGGGFTGYLSFNERYDPNSNSWSVVPTPFTGEWRSMGTASIGNDVYAVGGRSGQYMNYVGKYNPFPFNIFVPAATR